MKKEMLRKEIEGLNDRYEEIKEEINSEKAQGNLSKLYNLRNEFDTNFDYFFDDKDLRKKYNDWNYEAESIMFEKSNRDLLEELDEEDLKSYIEFYNNYISQLEDKLNELQEA